MELIWCDFGLFGNLTWVNKLWVGQNQKNDTTPQPQIFWDSAADVLIALLGPHSDRAESTNAIAATCLPLWVFGVQLIHWVHTV